MLCRLTERRNQIQWRHSIVGLVADHEKEAKGKNGARNINDCFEEKVSVAVDRPPDVGHVYKYFQNDTNHLRRLKYCQRVL